MNRTNPGQMKVEKTKKKSSQQEKPLGCDNVQSIASVISLTWTLYKAYICRNWAILYFTQVLQKMRKTNFILTKFMGVLSLRPRNWIAILHFTQIWQKNENE